MFKWKMVKVIVRAAQADKFGVTVRIVQTTLEPATTCRKLLRPGWVTNAVKLVGSQCLEPGTRKSKWTHLSRP